MTQNRWKSPVVWIATLTVLGAQIGILSQIPDTNLWAVAAAVVNVAIAFFAALNNPTDGKGF